MVKVGKARLKYKLVNIESALKILTEKEQLVLKMRNGIPPYERGYTLREIGDFLGTSDERPRVIEAKALRKLRHPSRNLNVVISL